MFFYHCMYNGVALLTSFKNAPFAFTMWLTVWCKKPNFGHVLAFDMPSSLSLIISSFWFKVRGVQLFLSLEHLEVILGLLIGFISIFLFHRKLGGPKREKEVGEWSVKIHTTCVNKVHILMGPWFVAPKNNYSSNIKDHWW